MAKLDICKSITRFSFVIALTTTFWGGATSTYAQSGGNWLRLQNNPNCSVWGDHRYKATDAGLEGIAWYCENCEQELYHEVWNTGEELSQAAYMERCGTP